MIRLNILLCLGVFLSTLTISTASAQEQIFQQDQSVAQELYTYAYITVRKRIFSKKMDVRADLGDTEEQEIAGKKLSIILSEKKSFAAVLNYMASLGYELVNTLDINSGGDSKEIVYIMKREDN